MGSHALFVTERYIRIDGKPLFLVYSVSELPSPLETATIWREEAQKLGIGALYLCTVESKDNVGIDPTRIGFDAAVEFQPDWLNLPRPLTTTEDGANIIDYGATVKNMLCKTPAPYKRFPCVTTGWDNTPRRQENGLVLSGSTTRFISNVAGKSHLSIRASQPG